MCRAAKAIAVFQTWLVYAQDKEIIDAGHFPGWLSSDYMIPESKILVTPDWSEKTWLSLESKFLTPPPPPPEKFFRVVGE